MKKAMFVIAVSMVMTACGSGSQEATVKTDSVTAVKDSCCTTTPVVDSVVVVDSVAH